MLQPHSQTSTPPEIQWKAASKQITLSQWPSVCPTVAAPCYNNPNHGILKRSSSELIHKTDRRLMVLFSIPPHLWHSHPLFLIEWLWLHSQCCFLCSNQKCSCPLPYSGNKSKRSTMLLHNTKATCTLYALILLQTFQGCHWIETGIYYCTCRIMCFSSPPSS